MALAKPHRHDVYAELEALPSNMVGQIISGALYAHPRPTRRHGRAAGGLNFAINGPFQFKQGGPGGWVFIPEHELHLGQHVVVPDISGWKTDRYPIAETTSYSVVPPDWLCEILSPSTARLDRFQKLPIYAGHSVHHCWYVDPIEKTLEVFILDQGTYKIGPTFTDSAPVTAPPFEAHTFALSLLWDEA